MSGVHFFKPLPFTVAGRLEVKDVDFFFNQSALDFERKCHLWGGGGLALNGACSSPIPQNILYTSRCFLLSFLCLDIFHPHANALLPMLVCVCSPKCLAVIGPPLF